MTTTFTTNIAEITEWADGQRLTDEDIERNPDFIPVALEWLKAGYPHQSDFLNSVYEYGKSKGKLSRKQVAGVLNCQVAWFKREQASSQPVATASQPLTAEEELFGKADNQPSDFTAKSEMPAEGYYTIIFATDDYVTLRVGDASWASNLPAGSQTVYYLSGPDNTRDYKGFGFIIPTDSAFPEYRPWNTFRNSTRLTDAVMTLFHDPEMAGKAYAEQSGRCRRCHRMLTVPSSLHAGYGPECITKVGM